MSVDPQQDQHAVRRERTDEAFKTDEPVHDPRVGPRVIPIIVAVVAIAVMLVMLLLVISGSPT